MNRLPTLVAVFVLASACSREAPPAPVQTTDSDGRSGGANEGPAQGPTVELTSEAQQRIGVVVAPAQEAPFAVGLQVVGSVQPLDSQLGHVRSLARGRVLDVRVRVGDRVGAGQSLATFDNIEAGELASQYRTARAELASLRAQLATVTRQADRNRKLVEIGAAPQKDAEASASEQQQLEESVRGQESTIAGMGERLRRFGVADVAAADQTSRTSIVAPFGGVVIKASAASGEVVDSSTELFTVADLSRVYVQAHVYEKDLARVQNGQTADIRVDAYPTERFGGKVVSIGDVIDPQTRTTTVRVEVANPRNLLKLDMFANVDLPTADKGKALVVPSGAVQTLENRSVVFVRTAPTTFVARTVDPGRTAGTQTEILRGLKSGDPVVVRGAFEIKSAAQAKDLGEKE